MGFSFKKALQGPTQFIKQVGGGTAKLVKKVPVVGRPGAKFIEKGTGISSKITGTIQKPFGKAYKKIIKNPLKEAGRDIDRYGYQKIRRPTTKGLEELGRGTKKVGQEIERGLEKSGKAMGQIGKGIGKAFGGGGGGKMGPPEAKPYEMTAAEKSYLVDLNKQRKGQGPSVAEQMIKLSGQKRSEQMAGLMASARGVQNPALMARMAQRQGAQERQEDMQQAATTRAQEAAVADQKYKEMLTLEQERKQDLEQLKAGVAKSNAEAGAAKRAQTMQMVSNLGSSAAMLGAAAMSDKSKKTETKPTSTKASSDRAAKEGVSIGNDKMKSYLEMIANKKNKREGYRHSYNGDEVKQQLAALEEEKKKRNLSAFGRV